MQFLGIILIFIGAFSILGLFTNIGFLYSFTDFWPSVLILYGIYRILKRKKGEITSYVFIILGIIFQLDNLSLLTPRISSFIWATALIIIGGILIFPKKKNYNNDSSKNNSNNNYYNSSKENKYYYGKSNYYEDVNGKEDNYNYSSYSKSNNHSKSNYSYGNETTYDIHEDYDNQYTEINSNLLDLSYSFGNNNIKVQSKSFSGGDITTTFGETKLNLVDVYPASQIIELYCNVYVGNLEILIPYNWSYEIIGKNIDLYEINNPECTMRIFYKNILGELIVNKA